MRRRSLVALVALSLAACGRHARTHASVTIPIESAAENKPFRAVDADAVDTTAIDSSVSPCIDFYSYACGSFDAHAAPSRDTPVAWRAFGPARNEADAVVGDLLDTWLASPETRSGEYDEVADFWAACNDEDAIEASGGADLRSLLASLRTSTPEEVAQSVAIVQLLGGHALFSLTAEPDLLEGTHWVALVRQPELTRSPDDYASWEETLRMRARIEGALDLADGDARKAERDAEAVVALEASLASAFESPAAFRDPARAVVPVGAGNLAALQPSFRWDVYFATLGISPPKLVQLATPGYIASAAVTRAITSPALGALLRWQAILTLQDALPRAYADAQPEAEWRSTHAGVDALPPRRRTCTRLAEDLYAGEIDPAFTARAVTDADVERASITATSVLDALRSRIEALPEANADVRRRALRKANALRVEIGSSSERHDLPQIPLDRARFLRDLVAARLSTHARALARIGRRVDSSPWLLHATSVNAELDIRRNRIEIAAGLLQPPFTCRTSDACELGTMGAIVGHEIAHAFDLVGWRYDALGNFDPVAARNAGDAPFAIAPLVARDLRGLTVDGIDLRVPHVVDESAADIVGLALAHDALGQRPLAAAETTKDRDRAFFTAFAQLWCARFNPASMRELVTHDAHPAPSVRVNEAVSHSAAFAAAFDCTSGLMARAPLP